jgi:hypothetical protein
MIKIKEDEIRVACIMHERKEKYIYKVLIGKSERKRSFRKLRCRREETITIYIKQIRWNTLDWIHLAQEGNSSRLF